MNVLHAETVNAAVHVVCGVNITAEYDSYNNLIINVPTAWKESIDPKIPTKFKGHDEALRNPASLMWLGVLRFRNTSGDAAYRTRPFCWENR